MLKKGRHFFLAVSMHQIVPEEVDYDLNHSYANSVWPRIRLQPSLTR